MAFVVLFRFRGINIFSTDLDTFLQYVSSGRYNLIKDFYILFDNHYLLGRGMKSIYDLVDIYDNILTKSLKTKTYDNFHNIFVNILYTSGIFLLLNFIIIGIMYIYRVIKNKQRDIYAVLVVVVGFIIAQLDVPLLYSTSVINIIWWLFLEYSGVKQ